MGRPALLAFLLERPTGWESVLFRSHTHTPPQACRIGVHAVARKAHRPVRRTDAREPEPAPRVRPRPARAVPGRHVSVPVARSRSALLRWTRLGFDHGRLSMGPELGLEMADSSRTPAGSMSACSAAAMAQHEWSLRFRFRATKMPKKSAASCSPSLSLCAFC